MRTALSLRMLRNNPLPIAIGVMAVAMLLLVARPHGKAERSATAAPAAPISSTVMVASRPIPAGTIILPADIRAKLVANAPPGAIGSRQAAIGRIADTKIALGDTLLRDNLRDVSVVGIAAHVPQGERAFSVRVAEDEIVGGFLQSGDRVDVFATIPGSAFPLKDAPNRPDRSQAVQLLQNVLVLAVGENPATGGSVQPGARTLTLSLAPAQLARLALAQRFGKVSFAIRKPGDDGVASAVAVTLTDLVPSEAPARPAPSSGRRPASGILFYSGTHATAMSRGGAP